MAGGGPSTTTSTNIPQWVTEAGKDIYGKAKSFYESGYTPYSGQRVADLSADQAAAFDAMRSYFEGGGSSGMNAEAANLFRQAASAPAQSVSTERIVDTGGRLGALDAYINPNVAATLQPTIRAITEEADRQRRNIGAMATSAGAYGDARHGVLESTLGRNTEMAIGDATGRAYADAWNNAMAARAADLNRFFGADTANAGFAETALGRTAAGGANLGSLAGADQDQFMARLSGLLQTGLGQQQQGQNILDTQYQAYQAQQQDAYDRLAALVSVISGLPYNRQTVTTQNDGGAGLIGALGSLIGAFL
jgi:hypothetical protein